MKKTVACGQWSVASRSKKTWSLALLLKTRFLSGIKTKTAIMLKEQPTLNSLTRHVDDEKADRIREVKELPGEARLGDEVIMNGELHKFLSDGWFKIKTEKV